jgi:D-glycero-alpha-D-manno-heptose-7-phosphate kinase
MKRNVVTASAPTRIDLAGGTIDIWPICVLVPQAVTVNVAMGLRAHATVETRRDDRVRVISRDRGARATRRLPLAAEDLTGPLAWLLRLVRAFAPKRGLSLTTTAEAPAGAGLGGSSALGIAVGAALARATGERLRGDALLRRVMNFETAEIGVPTGNQDFLAALHGGLAAYHHTADGTVRERLDLPEGLEERLVVVYTGQPRDSGFSNWEMFKRFVEGQRTTVRRMEAIARISRDLAAALREGELDDAGRLIGEEGRLRYRLAPSVATPLIRKVDRAARRAGALGVKVCGAGGGGCMAAFAASGKSSAVAAAMVRAGATLLEPRIVKRGLRVSGP